MNVRLAQGRNASRVVGDPSWTLAWLLGLGAFMGCAFRGEVPEQEPFPVASVVACGDFEIDGAGSAPAWARTEWIALEARDPELRTDRTRFKALYSETGIYFLLDAVDDKLTASLSEDFEHLWTEDVFEIFLWSDERWPVYFEYEISPLGYELPLLIPNFEGELLGWRPWKYEGARRVRKATSVTGGQRESGASITGWRAEVFVPYALLRPLAGVPPQPGTRWRANVYRMDYDTEPAGWDWARVGRSFHSIEQFGVLVFDR